MFWVYLFSSNNNKKNLIIIFILALYDEGGQFFGALGRYGSGGDKTGYDRSMYLTFWGAVDSFIRDLKGERTKLIMPRLMICLLTHPKTLATLLKGFRFVFIINLA